MNRLLILLAACLRTLEGFGGESPKADTGLTLPPPFATKSATVFAEVIGWQPGETPRAPAGFVVTKYADGFDNPRITRLTPAGEVLVVESNINFNPLLQAGAVIIGAAKSHSIRKSADRVMILRDGDGDGYPDQRDTFLSGLNQPYGMLFLDEHFYVANTDALWRYPYQPGNLRPSGPGEKVLDLPAGKRNQHWTRNILARPDGAKIYIAVGSASNITEHGMDIEVQRACILEVNPDGSDLRMYASGLRNPVGMDWCPATGDLWTVVNERDGLGDDLVPDYFTKVREAGFYGWPYTYIGNHPDPRVDEAAPLRSEETIVPDVLLTAHSATLGLLFYTGDQFPEKYKNGAFLAQHGSFNRSELSGYQVMFVPFKDGQPAGPPEEFLSGFIADADAKEVRGRPVGLMQMPDGSVLLTDDTSNTVWRIAYSGSGPGAAPAE